MRKPAQEKGEKRGKNYNKNKNNTVPVISLKYSEKPGLVIQRKSHHGNHDDFHFPRPLQSLGTALCHGNARAPLIPGIRIKRNKQEPVVEVDESVKSL